MVKKFFRGRVRSERGAELIELALVLPILMLVFAGIVDFGLLFQRFLTISNAAREGARIAGPPGYQPADVQSRVTDYLDATVSPTGCGVPSSLVVCIVDTSIDLPGTTPAFPAKEVTVSMEYSFLVLSPVSGLFGGVVFDDHIVRTLNYEDRVVNRVVGGER